MTFATLFWSLFGISSPKSTDLEEEHAFIETVGQGLFMAYHVMSIIVLINMLIAMMSNSFQQIEVYIFLILFFLSQLPLHFLFLVFVSLSVSVSFCLLHTYTHACTYTLTSPTYTYTHIACSPCASHCLSASLCVCCCSAFS